MSKEDILKSIANIIDNHQAAIESATESVLEQIVDLLRGEGSDELKELFDVYAPNSSCIDGAEYKSLEGSRTGILRVWFTSGGSARYEGVPRYVWEDFKESESAGKFYCTNIRGRY